MKEVIKKLQPYEKYFNTVINAKYARNPGAAALKEIHKVYTEATNDKQPLNLSCAVCVYNLLKSAGVFYFQEKEKQEKAKKQTQKKQPPKK